VKKAKAYRMQNGHMEVKFLFIFTSTKQKAALLFKDFIL
jgi:hypothetical protein